MNERTCIITRRKGEADQMLRFVLGPYNRVVPDLKGNLPGRGAWLINSRRLLRKAIISKAFMRSFKQDVCITYDMPDTLDRLLVLASLRSLSLARRGGGVVSGLSKVKKAIYSGKVCMVLHAKEAAADGKRKIAQAIYAAVQQKKQDEIIDALTLFTAEEMGLAFGRNNVIHAAVCRGLAASGFFKRTRKLIAYRDDVMNRYESTVVQEADTE